MKGGSFMYTMVVVDDEPLMLEGFSKAMDWNVYGYELIATFRHPSGILEFCRQHRPDILILDINMPETDGITLLKKVKEEFPRMYVIMLTAHNEFSYVRDSLRYHADEYLWKPEIDFHEILKCMNRLMEEKEDNQEVFEKTDKKIYEFVDYIKVNDRFSKEIFQSLVLDVERYLKLEDMNQLEEAIERIKEMILKDKPSKMDILSNLLYMVCLYREYGLQENLLDEKSILLFFYQKNTYQEFLDGVFKQFDIQNQLLKEYKEEQANELRRKIQCYIRENMVNTDMNLMQVSNAIGLSYSYCSRIFSELMGKNFSKYLIELRMEKACEYLKNSNYKIDKVLEMVGYTDKSYFVKSFRLYTGMTPFRYREKYKKPERNGGYEKEN